MDEVAATAEKRFGGWGGLITGTAPEVAETLAGYVARGAERFFLQFSDFGTPATLDAFAATVMPLLRGGRPSAEQVSRPGSTATA
jgi:alkanesulfonate monooxygenase SsuD/methylene tetrahydromethanopterin reductase-like flavin-dependent oxidoreductase (luciferase family)